MISKDDIKDLAHSNPILLACIKMHEEGLCTWEDAMMLAVIALNNRNIELTAKVIRQEMLKSRIVARGTKSEPVFEGSLSNVIYRNYMV